MYIIEPEKRTEILAIYNQYKSKFNNVEQEFFANFQKGENYFCDILLQLLTYTKAIDNEINPFFKFYNYLQSKHPNLSKRKILEVASGYIPALSYLITNFEKMDYPISTMDPNSLLIKINGIEQQPISFQKSTDISKYDLVIAHCPCEALKPLLESLIANKKEFSIQTCQCGASVDFNIYNRLDWLDYIDSVYEKALALEGDDFIVEKDYLTFSYILDAPIITARKKTKESHQ